MKITSKKKFCVLSVILILCGLIIWSVLIEPNQLIVKNYPIVIKDWSPKLNGFRIAVLSDIHGGTNFITQEKIREIVKLTNSQEPDVILLVGDYVSRQYFDHKKLNMPIRTVFENLRGLKAKFGVFAVLGNQDNNFGSQEIRKELENIGCKVLEMEISEINKNGEKLFFVGLPDSLIYKTFMPLSEKISESLSKINQEHGKVILFAHNPDIIWTVTETLSPSKDVVLFIGGHTHGGQIKFPVIGAPFVPTIYGQKYAKGHFQDKGIDVFIASGIGTSRFPARFGVLPEISVLEISAEN